MQFDPSTGHLFYPQRQHQLKLRQSLGFSTELQGYAHFRLSQILIRYDELVAVLTVQTIRQFLQRFTIDIQPAISPRRDPG